MGTGATLISTAQRLKRKAEISLIEFVRPDGYWPYPYSLEMAFHVFQELAKSGDGYIARGPWTWSGVPTLLGVPSRQYPYGNPIESVEDLRHRFHAALLGRGCEQVNAWRKDKGIGLDAPLGMSFPHYKAMNPPGELGFGSEDDVRKAVDALLIHAKDKVLPVSLNYVHPKANVVHRVDIKVSPEDGFNFILHFGFKTNADAKAHGDSEWSFSLASSQNGEPFLQVLSRALYVFRQLEQGLHKPNETEYKLVYVDDSISEVDDIGHVRKIVAESNGVYYPGLMKVFDRTSSPMYGEDFTRLDDAIRFVNFARKDEWASHLDASRSAEIPRERNR